MKVIHMSRIGVSTAVLLGIGILSGCATHQTLNPKIMAVEHNIGLAREKGADAYAPDVVQSAEAKLAEARSAVTANDFVKASRLLDEAMSDAEYAQIKAPTEKAKTEVDRLLADIGRLRDEISRMSAAN